MPVSSRLSHLIVLAALAGSLAACGGMRMPGSADSSAAGAGTAAPKSRAGMNERGEVIDPRAVEAGSGKTVKGLGDWEGEITGVPAPGSKFGQLQIGMPMNQVVALLGQPTDSGSHITGKAFIPFYFGSDRYRYEMVYKGQGRLIFAGGSIGNFMGGNLTWIIHSAAETGVR